MKSELTEMEFRSLNGLKVSFYYQECYILGRKDEWVRGRVINKHTEIYREELSE